MDILKWKTNSVCVCVCVCVYFLGGCCCFVVVVVVVAVVLIFVFKPIPYRNGICCRNTGASKILSLSLSLSLCNKNVFPALPPNLKIVTLEFYKMHVCVVKNQDFCSGLVSDASKERSRWTACRMISCYRSCSQGWKGFPLCGSVTSKLDGGCVSGRCCTCPETVSSQTSRELSRPSQWLGDRSMFLIPQRIMNQGNRGLSIVEVFLQSVVMLTLHNWE